MFWDRVAAPYDLFETIYNGKRYGSEKTKAIMAKALKRYDEIVEENRDDMDTRLNFEIKSV